MSPARLNALTDGVVAIVMTIMVLELRFPAMPRVQAVVAELPLLAAYLLAFTNVAIYWNNHHHLLHAIERVNGATLWANLHLLFWLSLVPFTTAWMGDNHFESWPVALYGIVLLLAAIAYYILVRTLLALHGRASTLAAAIGSDFKGKVSVAIYVPAIPLAFVRPWISWVCYVAVAIMWLVPDRRIEKRLAE